VTRYGGDVRTEWVQVGWSWLGHRPEPLIHERLWASPLTGSGPCRGLVDEHGRGLAYQQPGGHYEERTTYETDRITVDGIVETFLEHGRPTRSLYANGDEERYHYDGDRLIAIDEADTLDMTAQGAGSTGGRLELTYDERGLRSISSRWERLDEPWEDALGRGAADVAAEIVKDVERVVRSTDPIEVEIVSLTLTYVHRGGLVNEVALNPSREPNDFATGRGGWWPINEIECYVDAGHEARLISNAALQSIADPARTVLNAVAAVLARHDWSALFPVADDFVAFIAEHDEGFEEKIESLRAANPPERAEPWARLLEAEEEQFGQG
jgi:hypothetical protein